VSILSAGTFVGALLAFPLGDKIGRKWGLVSACVIFCLGVGLQLDTSWSVFVVGRVIAGIGGKWKNQSANVTFVRLTRDLPFPVGAVSCLVPMYQSECSPKAIRGLIVGLYQLAITIGALISSIVLNATKNQQSHSAWRVRLPRVFSSPR
jgi:MFS transporter, SP family, sugar:H+ symporter